MTRTRIRVHIGTTAGPAEIQRLTPEPPDIRSVVCLDGRAVALPISRDYESFVRRPTGIVERVWGGAAFRLDVGARITDGLSWQLGAFLAHGLHAAGRLAERGSNASGMIWATGEVDAALAVRPVDEVARKLELSVELLRGHAALRPWVMVPHEAAGLARSTLVALGLDGCCRVLGVSRAAEALAAVGLVLHDPAAGAPRTSAASNAPRRRWRLAALAATLMLLPALGAAGWMAWNWRLTVLDWTHQAEAGDLVQLDQHLSTVAATASCLTCATAARLFRDWLATQLPPGGPLVQVEETRRSAYGGCGATASPSSRLALSDAPGAGVSVGLCRARYLVGGAPFVAVFVSSPALRQGSDNAVAGAGEVAVTVDVPPLLIYATEQRVVALASRLPVDKTLAWLRPLLPPPPGGLPDATVARLAEMGVAVRVLHHRIDPDRGM